MEEEQFKALRHRYWSLGKPYRLQVLQDLGKKDAEEELIQSVERDRLYQLKEEDRTADLVAAIELYEEIKAAEEKENPPGREYVNVVLPPLEAIDIPGSVKLTKVERPTRR